MSSTLIDPNPSRATSSLRACIFIASGSMGLLSDELEIRHVIKCKGSGMEFCREHSRVQNGRALGLGSRDTSLLQHISGTAHTFFMAFIQPAVVRNLPSATVNFYTGKTIYQEVAG